MTSLNSLVKTLLTKKVTFIFVLLASQAAFSGSKAPAEPVPETRLNLVIATVTKTEVFGRVLFRLAKGQIDGALNHLEKAEKQDLTRKIKHHQLSSLLVDQISNAGTLITRSVANELRRNNQSYEDHIVLFSQYFSLNSGSSTPNAGFPYDQESYRAWVNNRAHGLSVYLFPIKGHTHDVGHTLGLGHGDKGSFELSQGAIRNYGRGYKVGEDLKFNIFDVSPFIACTAMRSCGIIHTLPATLAGGQYEVIAKDNADWRFGTHLNHFSSPNTKIAGLFRTGTGDVNRRNLKDDRGPYRDSAKAITETTLKWMAEWD